MYMYIYIYSTLACVLRDQLGHPRDDEVAGRWLIRFGSQLELLDKTSAFPPKSHSE